MNFSTNFKNLRLKSGMTQAELGDALGVSDKTVSKWENGAFQPPLEKLVAVADIFGVTIDSLFDRMHDMKNDIFKSVADYMRSVEPSSAIKCARELASYIILGAQIKKVEASGCYTQNIIADLKEELEKLIMNGDERPQRYFYEKEKTQGRDFQSGSMDNYIGDDLKLTVFQEYEEDAFQKILSKYGDYKKVFDFLAMPDADKVLILRYSNEMPENYTASYLSEKSGAELSTVETFLDLCDSHLQSQKLTINGASDLMFEKSTAYGAQSLLQTVVASAYAFEAKRKEGHR